MGETKEWFANVMVCEGADGRLYHGHGPEFAFRSDADVHLRGNRNANRFRIHVRLKPEGAPKRYRDELDRTMWEIGHSSRQPYIRAAQARAALAEGETQ